VPISAAISVPCIVVALNVELFSRSRARLADIIKKLSPKSTETSKTKEAKRPDLETGLYDVISTARFAKTQSYQGQSTPRSPYRLNL
jgi:hypothetical protein